MTYFVKYIASNIGRCCLVPLHKNHDESDTLSTLVIQHATCRECISAYPGHLANDKGVQAYYQLITLDNVLA